MRTAGRAGKTLVALWMLVSTIGTPSSHAQGVPWTVVVARFKFLPGDRSLQPDGAYPVLQIAKDDTLTMENLDSDQHSLTADLRVCLIPECKDWQKVPAFDSRPVRPSQSATVSFVDFIREDAGTYSFHCMFHVDMRGILALR